MARHRTPQTMEKRRREMEKQQKRQAKHAQRLERNAARREAKRQADGTAPATPETPTIDPGEAGQPDPSPTP